VRAPVGEPVWVVQGESEMMSGQGGHHERFALAALTLTALGLGMIDGPLRRRAARRRPRSAAELVEVQYRPYYRQDRRYHRQERRAERRAWTQERERQVARRAYRAGRRDSYVGRRY
jgi:hypothetical protein